MTLTPIVFETADLFCGAGGTSTGAERAVKEMGAELHLVAINHWPIAIETHRKNHPTAQHYIQDVTLADPKSCVERGFLHLLMASPECTYHSNARGGKPVHDQKRMDPWAVVRWLTNLNVRCLLVENVPEFVDWGPLCTLDRGHEGAHGQGWLGEGDPASCGKRDPRRKGNYFQAWRKAIIELGYDLQFRTLNAADFGDATTRTRLFVIARKDGVSIRWPEPSHARKGEDKLFGGRERWRAAREIIDWQNPGRSIIDHPKYVKQPLSLKTRMRMARGLERFGGPLAHHFIALLGLDAEQGVAVGEAESFVMGKQSSPVYRTLDEPVPTLTTESAPLVVEPLLDLVGANRNHNVPRDMGEPVPPATTAPGGGLYFIEAVALPFVLGQQSGGAPRETAEPIPTVAADGAISLVQPILIPYYRTGVAKDVSEPLETVTTKGRFGLAEPLVVPYGPEAAARNIDQPVHTILGKDRLGVAFPGAEPFVMNNAPHTADALGVRSSDDPLYTVVTNPRLVVVQPEAFIIPQFAERDGQAPRVHDLDEPLPTATASGAGKLVQPFVQQIDQSGAAGAHVRSTDVPLATLVTKANQAVVSPFVLQVNHSGDDPSRVRGADEPVFTLSTHRNIALAEPIVEAIRDGQLDPRRLIVIDGQLHQLDIRFRMLTNRELARAMSFDDEETEYEFVGNTGEVTKQIGNAVPVRTACALVKTILEDCMAVPS